MLIIDNVKVSDPWRIRLLEWSLLGGALSWAEREELGFSTDGLYMNWDEFPAIMQSLALDGL